MTSEDVAGTQAEWLDGWRSGCLQVRATELLGDEQSWIYTLLARWKDRPLDASSAGYVAALKASCGLEG